MHFEVSLHFAEALFFVRKIHKKISIIMSQKYKMVNYREILSQYSYIYARDKKLYQIEKER